MRNFFIILLAGNIFLYGNAWADTRSTSGLKTKKCYFPKTKKTAPDWICNPQIEQMTFSAVGSSEKSEAGTEFMEQMATAHARTILAKKMNSAISKKIASASGQTDNPDSVLVAKITSISLEGTKVINKAYAPNGRLYVLIGLDEPETQKLYETVSKNYLKQKN
jgi:hypothetical protein